MWRKDAAVAAPSPHRVVLCLDSPGALNQDPRAARGGMTRVRLGGGQCCLPVGAWLTRGLARRGAPRSHQSIGGPSPSWLAVSSAWQMLQNFQSSFAARDC